jgi:antitoxin CcdA
MNARVTVEIDAETLKQAQEKGVDLSRALQRAVERELSLRQTDEEKKAAAERWYRENKDEVDSYNEFIAKHGLFSDHTRKF